MSRRGESRQSLSEHDEEALPGLPGPLPAGETLLWQGAPGWRTLARSLHVRELAIYFLVLTAIRAVTAWDGSVADEITTVLQLLGVSAAALGLICLFAWLSARSTIYTITERRLVVRYGVALSKAVNIPFSMVTGAALRLNADGTGDVTLQLAHADRVPYVMLWPHVRPWRFSPAQPMLRAIPGAASVAQTLARALAAEVGGQVEPVAAGPVRNRGLAPDVRPGGAVAA